ncbi:MAG: hypothetical protein IJ929_03565 [Prevotella sp.]|nr:hypothetical protein [Prevotella sp.]
MKFQQLLSIILISICSLMLTACEVDNSENGTDYLALLKETHWQLSETYVDHEWQTPAVYDELDIKDLWFYGDKKYQISIFNFDGNRGNNTIQGSFKIESNTINFFTNNIYGTLFSIYISSIDKNQLEGVLTIYEEQTATPNTDGSTSFSQKSRTYTIRMKRK